MNVQIDINTLYSETEGGGGIRWCTRKVTKQTKLYRKEDKLKYKMEYREQDRMWMIIM
jgi:hypothetical protein